MTGRKYNNILDAIGNTPLIKLNHITKDLKANIYAKLEFTNPGGSIKDRIALYMIEKAERNGIIKSGDTIVENSSGNTAMGLAIVCRHKGYNLKIVIRDTTSKEKIKMLEVLGVDVIKADASLPPEHPDSYNNYARRQIGYDDTAESVAILPVPLGQDKYEIIPVVLQSLTY